MSEKKQWGGKRIPGEGKSLGRPAQLQDPERVTIWIDKEQLAWVLGQGDKSEVIRRLIAEAMSKPAS